MDWYKVTKWNDYNRLQYSNVILPKCNLKRSTSERLD